MIKVTLDTNVLIAGTDGEQTEREAFEKLVRLEESGSIQISVTSRIEQDKRKDSDSDRRNRHTELAAQFSQTPAPFRLDVSCLDGPDVIVDGEIADELARIFEVTTPNLESPNTMWDMDHVYAHLTSGGDIFLTYDKGILRRRDPLLTLGIRVMEPLEFLRSVAE